MNIEVRRGAAQAITLCYVATILVLAGAAALNYRSASTQVDMVGWVSHTHEVMAHLSSVEDATSSAESSVRGYVITGDETFLSGYDEWVQTARREVGAVEALTRDNPNQQACVPDLRNALQAKIEGMGRPISIRRGASFEKARAFVASGRGQAAMRRLRSVIAAMKREEARLLARRRRGALRGQETYRTSFWFGTLASLLFLTGFYVASRRYLDEQIARRRQDEAHRAELEGRVRERTAELEALNQDLESFSYSVSHDLRGPLRNIGAQAAMLEEDLAHIPEEQRKAFDLIRRNVKRMGSLMDDLLRLSRAARGELRRQPIDLSEMARRTLAEIASRHPREGVAIKVEEGLSANADPSMVSILLDNLLRNAWKYSSKTPNAEIEVGCEEGAYFVRDNGAGFDDARFAEAMEPFQRLHGREFEGTGIGLAICGRVVARHGGRMWARSQPGEGATVYFTLAEGDDSRG